MSGQEQQLDANVENLKGFKPSRGDDSGTEVIKLGNAKLCKKLPNIVTCPLSMEARWCLVRIG